MTRPSLLGIMLAVVGTGLMAGMSRLPFTAETDRAVLRLSWRYQPGDEAGCRLPTPEELADLPVHMRNPNACIRHPTPYRLTLRIDDAIALERTIRAAGAREDRPVFVFEEVPLRAGSRSLDVRFEAVPDSSASDAATDAPLSLSWRETVTIEPRDVVVVGYDRSLNVLERVGPIGADDR